MITALSQFAGSAASTLVVEELRPCPDSWDVAQRLAALPHLLFLDSASGHPTLGRYSFVTADPAEWLWSRGNWVWSCDAIGLLPHTDPFRTVAERLARFRVTAHPELPPFQGC